MLVTSTGNWWGNCRYAVDFPYLGPNIYKRIHIHKEYIFIVCLHTHTAMTEKRLHTFKLKNSPTCSLCSAEDKSEFHYVFSCHVFEAERLL